LKYSATGSGQATIEIQVPRSLNQCCAADSYLESILLTRALENVFQQHRSEADMRGLDRQRHVPSIQSRHYMNCMN
jgi:hypothetical protein